VRCPALHCEQLRYLPWRFSNLLRELLQGLQHNFNRAVPLLLRQRCPGAFLAMRRRQYNIRRWLFFNLHPLIRFQLLLTDNKQHKLLLLVFLHLSHYLPNRLDPKIRGQQLSQVVIQTRPADPRMGQCRLQEHPWAQPGRQEQPGAHRQHHQHGPILRCRVHQGQQPLLGHH
jgi:hypothetical protein